MQDAVSRSPITRFVVIVTASLVSFVGLSTLLGLTFGNLAYAIPDAVPLIGGVSGTLPTGYIALIFVRGAVITLSFAVLAGVLNLMLVNVQRVLRGRTISARLNSIVVLLMFLVGLVTPEFNPEFSDFLLENVQTTIESALAGLIFFALVFGGFRILRRKVTLPAILFVLTVEIVLIGALPVESFGIVRQFTDWLFNVPVNAGARGILLGIALATLITGLRVLIGQDRNYGE